MNEKHIENYTTYQQPQCLKQVVSETQMYPNFALNSTFSSVNYMDIYNISSQNIHFQQTNYNSIGQHEHFDLQQWESKMVPNMKNRLIKESDKIVCNKDLTPINYCNNTNVLNSCRQTADLHINKPENDWYFNGSSCSQRNSEYTSCAQEKLIKYCNTQNFNLTDDITCKMNNKNLANELASDYMYNYYDNKFIENQQFIQDEQFFDTNVNIPFEPILNPIDQQTEGSNEESDIIVEESDEDITDFSEDNEKQVSHSTSKCLICNTVYTPLGTQFYFLSEENPLTMTTQKAIVQKLINILGWIPGTTNYLCSDCLGLINNIDHLQLKLKTMINDLTMQFEKTCTENKINFARRKMNTKSGSNKFPRYKCKLCKKIMCLKRYCVHHIKQHRNPGCLCEVCGKIFPNKKKFFSHSLQHKKKFSRNIRGIKCSNCNKIFRTKYHQKEHENYCLGTLPFKCEYQHCDKKFPTPTKLKSHIKLKHDKKFIIICSICNIGFIKVSDYKSHMVSHSTDKKYSCTKCNKSYKTVSNLNFHMKIHKNSMPFSCQICSKGFMRKEYLEAHINNHNGVKNFTCTNCGKKFVSQKNLDAHLKYHEALLQKNTCGICGKKVTSKYEEHLRIHNNLREFECEQCDMKFNTKGTLSKHVKKKHLKTFL